MTVLALGQAFAQIPRGNRGLERFSSAESRGEACFHYAEAQKTTLEKEQYCDQMLSAMSLDEKISLLQHRNPPIERLGLRGYMTEVVICNMMGQIIGTFTCSDDQMIINTAQYEAGIYNATIRTANGTTSSRFTVLH